MNKDSKIYVAGHRGLVGSAIVRKLKEEGYTNIITRTSEELDLTKQIDVMQFFLDNNPEYVFLTAAKAGGVLALDTYRAESMYVNLMIQNNVIHNCYLNNVKKLLFIGSNCIYPKLVTQPIKEEYILAGKLEPTTEDYALAKIVGVKMCQAYRKQYGCNFISMIPVNLYGESEKYIPEHSHVMTALLHKFKEAKDNNAPSVEIWGTGNARREFMYVDDVADACLWLMLNYNEADHINVGSKWDIPINGLAMMIRDIIKYKGDIVFNSDKPDGTLSKLLDTTKINKLGWSPKIPLREGIERVYASL